MALPKKTVQRAHTVAEKRQPGTSGPLPAATPHRTGSRAGARSVGSFVPGLTRTAFEKFGFSTAALITDWAQIVGPALAETTVPDRIRWPKSVDQDAQAGRAGPRGGATLHISVEPARALDVQYKTQLIIERINSYFGYRAVAELRIVQARVALTPTAPKIQAKPAAPVTPDPTVAAIGDEGLRAAFERMQAGMMARRAAATRG